MVQSPYICRRCKDTGLIPGSGRSPGEGKWLPTPVFLPENPMDRGAWQAIVHWVAESDTTEHEKALGVECSLQTRGLPLFFLGFFFFGHPTWHVGS